MDFKNVKGVIPPIITPVLKNEEVDEVGFRKLLTFCVDNGVHGIFVAGTNGETMALTQKQRNNAIKIALDEVDKRVPIMCGVMDTGTKRVIENIKELEQMGGEIAVVTTDFYSRHSCEAEILRHFEHIAKNTNIKIMIYNIPPFVGTNISNQIVFKIAEFENVIGYKDSAGNFAQLQNCLQYFENKNRDFKILVGATELAAAAMLQGAHGYIPSMAPVFPKLFVKLYEAAGKKDIDETKRLNKLVCKTSKILKISKNATAATKYAISLHGFTNKRVLMPAEPTTPEDEKKIREIVDEIKEDLRQIKLL